MGYTHYFGPMSLTADQFLTVSNASKKVVEIATGEMGVSLAYESDEQKRAPELSGDRIRFNGVGDEGHETFILEPTGDEFCKTARKPYDIAVVAILCLLHHYGGTSVRSDGSPSDWKDGLALAQRVEPACKMPDEV